MDKINVAIIGCGGIARNKHIKNLLLVEDANITALYDYNKPAAIDVNETMLDNKAVVYETYDALLKDKTIDVVHICTPNAFHAPMSIAAMEAGKHVMCEKPMAMNSMEAKDMVDTSIKMNKQLGIALQNRFRRDSLHLKKLVESNQLGDIYYAKAHALRRRAVPVWGDFLNKEKQGGGALIDIGVHALDLTLWLMGKYNVEYVIGKTYKKIGERPTDYNVWGDWDPQKFEVDDAAFAQIIMADGSTVNLEASWALNTLNVGEAKTTLHGTIAGADMQDGLRINGTLHKDLFTRTIDLKKEDIEWYNKKCEDEGCAEMHAWIHSIKTNTPYIVRPKEVLVVTKVIEAIYESSEKNKPIYLGEMYGKDI